jgi:RimJ/RimL family protein N-acetyltransferase
MSLAFQGKLVTLRAFEPEDVPTLHTYLSHPDLIGRRYIPWESSEIFPLSRNQVEGIYSSWADEKKGIHLAVVLSESQELVGHAECDWGWDPHCPSISLVIAPAHQRKGYGSEVLNLLLRYLFEHTQAHNVSCWIADWNQAGRLFMEEHGFQECGRMRRVGIHEGKYFDFIITDLLRREWEQTEKGGDHVA